MKPVPTTSSPNTPSITPAPSPAPVPNKLLNSQWRSALSQRLSVSASKPFTHFKIYISNPLNLSLSRPQSHLLQRCCNNMPKDPHKEHKAVVDRGTAFRTFEGQSFFRLSLVTGGC